MQQIANQVTMWQNEWFVDLTIGIDYIGFENKDFLTKKLF